MSSPHFSYENPQPPSWTLDELFFAAKRNVRYTLECINSLEKKTASDSFIYNWTLIIQASILNNSVAKYLDSKTIKECVNLVESFKKIESKYSVVNRENDKLPPLDQDMLASQSIDAMYADSEYLSIYRYKLGLETRILNLVTSKLPSVL